jgi:hypothetical protein
MKISIKKLQEEFESWSYVYFQEFELALHNKNISLKEAA